VTDRVGDRLGDAATRVGDAATRVGGAADRTSLAAARAETLLAPGSPLHSSVLNAADEMGRSAVALRGAVADDGATVQSLQRALADVSRATRALRELAEQLEQQPQSLIRGKEASP
jgi:paraquat-inducible protein B